MRVSAGQMRACVASAGIGLQCRLAGTARLSAQRRLAVLARYQSVVAEATTSAQPSAGEAGKTSSTGTPKPMGIGSRIVDWIVDNPGLFFGSLIGSLVLWIAHGSIGGRQRDAAIAALETTAPISSREITEVGRANSVPRDVFERVIEAALQNSTDGMATPSELSLLLRKELASVGHARAAPASDPLSLPGEHHLRRAALALAGVDKDTSARDVGVPVLQLLSLYGSVMGGRAEAKAPSLASAPQSASVAPAPVADGDPAYPTPSERVQMWLELVRRAAGSVPGGGLPHGMASESELVAVTELLARTWQVPPRARVHEVTSLPYPVYAPRDAAQHVAAAVAEVRVDEERGKALTKAQEEAAKAAAAAGSDAPLAPTGPSTAHGSVGGTFVDPGTLAPCPATSADGSRLFSRWEVSRVLLRSKAICAWNECHDR